MQSSRNREEFERHFNNLRLVNPRAAIYVRSIPTEHWCRFEAEANHVSLYGIRTNNAVEQEFSRLRHLRELPLYEFLDSVVKLMAEIFARGKQLARLEALTPSVIVSVVMDR